MTRRWAGLILAAAVATAAPGTARAQEPSGFHATGTLVVAATIGGSPLNVGGDVALYERAGRYRLDLLSLAFPGTDATASSVAGALLAPGGATVIYDGISGMLSAYSTGNRVYYQQAPPPRSVAPAAPPAPVAPADPLAALAGVARQLRDVARASIMLTGHSVTNGHPTADLDVQLRRQRPGKPVEEYHAQVSLADDLGGFPVRIAVSSTPATPQDVGGSLRLDLTNVVREAPAATAFDIPAGYTRVDSLGAVLQAKH